MKPHAGGAVSRVRFSSRYYTDVRRQILAAFAAAAAAAVAASLPRRPVRPSAPFVGRDGRKAGSSVVASLCRRVSRLVRAGTSRAAAAAAPPRRLGARRRR